MWGTLRGDYCTCGTSGDDDHKVFGREEVIRVNLARDVHGAGSRTRCRGVERCRTEYVNMSQKTVAELRLADDALLMMEVIESEFSGSCSMPDTTEQSCQQRPIHIDA